MTYFKYLWLLIFAAACQQKPTTDIATDQTSYFNWEGATVYFMLTDRFNNGNSDNDVSFDRTQETGVLRGFEGGDIAGVTQKINEGYFDDLGVHAIWLTPLVEQIHEGTDEGTGFTYGYHGYWAKDWTALDPNFGTEQELEAMVTAAHARGIRILFDAVINHHGPETPLDGIWPEDWVRRGPTCTFDSYAGTTACNLVKNLPDVLTESNQSVDLPPQLVEKWKAEGRYAQELEELDAFFARTGHPRAPRFYIMKWLSDFVTDYGIDGFRVDTAKHTEASVWQEFKAVCAGAFEQWKAAHPESRLDETPFYMVGEVYSYDLHHLKEHDFGDKKETFFDNSFDALINFHLKTTAEQPLDSVYQDYATLLNGPMEGYSTLNFMTSHDDGSPYDAPRTNPYETATRLLMAPGAAQIYYGDESARSLMIDGTQGDATLRSFMNWDDLANDPETKLIQAHWQKLGQFRARHFAIGAGLHKAWAEIPYTFSRDLTDGTYQDAVVVSIATNDADQDQDLEVFVGTTFSPGTVLFEFYTRQEVVVSPTSTVMISKPGRVVLLEGL